MPNSDYSKLDEEFARLRKIIVIKNNSVQSKKPKNRD